MHYRLLGNTGLSVSEIGLGCEGLTAKDDAYTDAFFAAARRAGVNCMDLYSPNPDLHRRVGNAIRESREEFILQAHLCTHWKDGQYAVTRDLAETRTAFEALLQNVSTDYVDIGMVHYVDSAETWRALFDNGIIDYATELKKAGRIRHFGLSSHNPIVALEAVRSGLVEVLMFSINPCYDLLPGTEDCGELWSDKSYEKPLYNIAPERRELYETCQRMGVGITVMKVFGGGDLLSDRSPAGKALTVNQCLHYALTRPAVATVLAGVHSMEELSASLAYAEASNTERDYAEVFAAFPRISWQGHCMYCGHCAPCPAAIDVAGVTKLLHLALAQGELPETVREHYAALAVHAGDCLSCGACESRCPFAVSVVENMQKAAEIFGY